MRLTGQYLFNFWIGKNSVALCFFTDWTWNLWFRIVFNKVPQTFPELQER